MSPLVIFILVLAAVSALIVWRSGSWRKWVNLQLVARDDVRFDPRREDATLRFLDRLEKPKSEFRPSLSGMHLIGWLQSEYAPSWVNSNLEEYSGDAQLLRTELNCRIKARKL